MLNKNDASIIFILCFADFFPFQSAITIGAGYIGAPLVLADYKEDERVRCASPIFMLIKKQTDIDRHGLKPSSNTSSLPTPSFFIGHFFNLLFLFDTDTKYNYRQRGQPIIN
jgi:hypothetical protein